MAAAASQPVVGHGGGVVRGTVLQTLPPQNIVGGVASYNYGGEPCIYGSC